MDLILRSIDTSTAAYLIWKYGFTANEAIAFMRIIRPGCVVGPQQVGQLILFQSAS
jgi:protein-tyrosine phosphatase